MLLLNKDLFLLLLVSVKLAISPSAVDVDEMRSLIDFQSEVSFSDKVSPICLPSPGKSWNYRS